MLIKQRAKNNNSEQLFLYFMSIKKHSFGISGLKFKSE